MDWSEHEDLQVLDPKAGFADVLDDRDDRTIESVESVPAANAGLVSKAMESQFSVTRVVTLPTVAMTGAGMIAPAASRARLDDEFEVGEDRESMRRWATRFSDSDRNGTWIDGRQEVQVAEAPEDSEASEVENDGFFARLWGAVRGLAGAGSRGGSDERDHKRN